MERKKDAIFESFIKSYLAQPVPGKHMVQTVLGHAVSTVAAVKSATRTMDIVYMGVNQVTHLDSVITVRTLEIKIFTALKKPQI